MKTKKSLKAELADLVAKFGHNGELHTFEYDCMLDGSTIDKVVVKGDRVYLYYNENTGDLDPVEEFTATGLTRFINGVRDAITSKEE